MYCSRLIKGLSGNEVTSENHIGNLNKIRYRGYYQDTETGFYYLMSRYYDPVTHRFLNADGYFQTGTGMLDTNMFAYCLNNPCNFVDSCGTIPVRIGNHIQPPVMRNYLIVKQVISVAANIYLSSNNLKISKAMFNVGMWGEGKDLSPNIKEMIIKKLLVNSTMVQRIRNILSNTRQSTITNAQYTLEFKNNRENRDLYYSLQHINFSITGSKKNRLWTVRIKVWDRYDFTQIRSIHGLSFGNAANDLGYFMQSAGMMIPYN